MKIALLLAALLVAACTNKVEIDCKERKVKIELELGNQRLAEISKNAMEQLAECDKRP